MSATSGPEEEPASRTAQPGQPAGKDDGDQAAGQQPDTCQHDNTANTTSTSGREGSEEEQEQQSEADSQQAKTPCAFYMRTGTCAYVSGFAGNNIGGGPAAGVRVCGV